MKVLVIGATGGTGQHGVRKLLDAGHMVTALVRNPAAFTQKHENLRVIQGDARDAAAVRSAVQGQDAVLAAFGPRSLFDRDVQQVFMGNLLTAMKEHKVRRLVNLSALGAGDTRDSVPAIFKVIRAVLLPRVFADKERGETLLFASDIDFINVRPGRLVNSAARGGVKANLDGKGLKPIMTREDLADFMIAQLQSNTWVRKSPVIGY